MHATVRHFLAAAVLHLLAAFGFAGHAVAQTPSPPPPAAQPQAPRVPIEDELERLKLQLDQIARSLARENLADADLAANRRAIDPIAQRIDALIAEQRPKVEALAAQLEKLGPKPDARAAPESAEAAKQRADLESARENADGVLRIAQSLQVRAGQLVTQTAERRRGLIARALFERSYSLVSPWLWSDVLRAAPAEGRALATTFGDWSDEAVRRFRAGHWPAMLLALFIALAMLGPARALAGWGDPRTRAKGTPTPARKVLVAAAMVLAGWGVLTIAAVVVYTLLEDAGVLPQRVAPILAVAVFGAAKFAAMNILADTYFAPRHAAWRLSAAPDARAARVVRAVYVCGFVLYAGQFANTLMEAIGAAEPVAVAVRGFFAALFALALLGALQRLHAEESCEDESLGPAIPVSAGLFGSVRTLLVIAAAAILVAVLAGFVRLGFFLAEQVAWLTAVGIVLALAIRLADEWFARLLTGEGAVGRALMVGVGFRRRPLEQAAVLVSGLARLALFFAAALLVLAPWGVESGDVLGSLRAALFGFRIGDVTISLSSIVIALAVFAVGILGTRGLQRWLDDTFLPRTDLDAGLRNSIRTAIGYLGFVIAAIVAVSAVGFSLDRITIVVGALSVGIGLGLQAVVSNFVSGLILLWERSIKVGDLVVVGEETGHVRRIHVRSTEVQTADRTVVIVPNSNFITGVVKNKVHAGRLGRVSLSLAVPREADPRAVAAILERVIADHPDVVDDPPARAVFKRIGEANLEMEIGAFVVDVEKVGRVTSDLNFALHEELRQSGLLKPATPPAPANAPAPARA